MQNIFLKPSDPTLVRIAKEITKSQISSKKTQKIIERMLKMALGQQKERSKPVMMGLAAPQIGISKRIILVDIKADGKGRVGDLRIYINPKIIWKSKRKGEWYEGCYSTSRVCGIVKRPISIKVKGVILASQGDALRAWEAQVAEEKYSGYVARIFQHEIDHLNGRVFVDLIKDPDKLHWVLKKEFLLYRNKQAWRNWPKKCSFEKWQKLKNPLLKKA